MYPYYFTFTTFTKGRWVGEKILDVFAREFRAHPAEEYERCIKAGTLTVNYEKVPTDYRLKHNDLLANVVHRLVIYYILITRKPARTNINTHTYTPTHTHTNIPTLYFIVFCFVPVNILLLYTLGRVFILILCADSFVCFML